MRRYKKSFKTKKKKKIFSIKIVLIVSTFLIISSGFVYLFFFSSIFQVKKIEVLGVEKIPAEEIKNIISEKTSKNIFLANLDGVKNYLIESYPEIARINIRRKLPDIILTEIEERKPVAVLNNSFILDKEGVAFEKSSDSSLPEIIKTTNSDLKLGQKAVDRIDDILKIIKRIKTKQVVWVSDKKLDVKTIDGFDVYFNLEKDVDWQIEQLEILLQEKIPLQERDDIEYIDLRFDRIFIYPEQR